MKPRPGKSPSTNHPQIHVSRKSYRQKSLTLRKGSLSYSSYGSRDYNRFHLNSSAYVAEIFRAGILAVDKGQAEAARSLGLSQWQSMRLVVLPQAVKNVLPALANEMVTMVKESSICSVLGMAEMMFAAKTIAGSTGISLAPYTLAALVYFCINYPASKGIEAIERRMRRGDKQ